VIIILTAKRNFGRFSRMRAVDTPATGELKGSHLALYAHVLTTPSELHSLFLVPLLVFPGTHRSRPYISHPLQHLPKISTHYHHSWSTKRPDSSLSASPLSKYATMGTSKVGILDIPPELRLKIYCCYSVIGVADVEGRHHLPDTVDTPASSHLLWSCKLVHAEGLSILYGQNVLSSHSSDTISGTSSWRRSQIERQAYQLPISTPHQVIVEDVDF
jgi:hypothetical protein